MTEPRDWMEQDRRVIELCQSKRGATFVMAQALDRAHRALVLLLEHAEHRCPCQSVSCSVADAIRRGEF